MNYELISNYKLKNKNLKSKVRIAIFHCGFIYSGGGERIVLEEAKGLIKRGYKVEVFAPTLDKNLCFPEFVREVNVKTFLPQLPSFIPARHAILMVLSSLLAPFFAFRFRKIDVFLGANQPGAWIAFCVSKILRKPYLVYMNQPNRLLYPRKIDEEVHWQNLREYYFVDNLIKRMRSFVSWADRISFTSAKVIFENGEYIGKIIKEVYRCKALSCPAGAYVQKISKNKNGDSFEIKNLKRKSFKINSPYILLTNRHVPQKKFEYGLEALKIIKEKKPNVILVIPGPYTEHSFKLFDLAEKLGVSNKVLFLDQINEETLRNLYKNACLYIYTAAEEDFGMGIIEAMAYGVPVVAWNKGGPSTTVVDGKTGFLAKPYDVLDFAQKMSDLLSNQKLRDKMGKNAREHVKNNFTWQKHVDILERSLRSSIKN